MPRAKATNSGLWGRRILPAVGAAILASCGQPSAGSHPRSSPTGQVAAVSSPSTTSVARCSTSQLDFSFGKGAAATGNYLETINIVNRSGPACYLGGYPGVEQIDGGNHPVGEAQRSTDSFFGIYSAPARVDLPSGGSTSFDLTFGRADACPGGSQPVTVAGLRITPPGDYESKTLKESPGPACAHGLFVHPVGGSPNPYGG